MKKLLPLLVLLLSSCYKSNVVDNTTPRFVKFDNYYNDCSVFYDEYYRADITYKEWNTEHTTIVVEKHWLLYPDMTIYKRSYGNRDYYNLLEYDNATHYILVVELQ